VLRKEKSEIREEKKKQNKRKNQLMYVLHVIKTNLQISMIKRILFILLIILKNIEREEFDALNFFYFCLFFFFIFTCLLLTFSLVFFLHSCSLYLLADSSWTSVTDYIFCWIKSADMLSSNLKKFFWKSFSDFF